MPSHAVLTTLADQPGMLFRVTQVLARHDANIEHIDIVQEPRLEATVYFEFSCKTPIEQIVSEMQDVPGVLRVASQSFGGVYGKRIIIMGGGAQVGRSRWARSSRPIDTTSAASISLSIRFRRRRGTIWRPQCARSSCCRACGFSCWQAR
jgi:predicted amino acid-binding ACT domain protein